MKLGYFDTNLRNVGDDLNPFIWSKYFPNIEKVHEDTVFIGIGSVFDKRFAQDKRKLVFGPGARGEHALPELDDSWDIRFVRGPLSQQAVKNRGVDCKYITDPGLLVSQFFDKKNLNTDTIGLIPYYKTEHQPWQSIADSLGFKLISPRLSVQDFTAAIRQCQFVVTEAMHGAIIADAFRVPWLPYSSITAKHELETHAFKWTDWCQSVGLEFNEIMLPILWSATGQSLPGRLIQYFKSRYICAKLKKYAVLDNAYLSDDKVFATRTQQLLDEIQQLTKDYGI